jgi:two-component system sensor histidine kinase RpfC
MKRFAAALIKGLGLGQTQRRDPDLEQAVLRVILSVIVFFYVVFLVWVEGRLSYGLQVALVASLLNTTVGVWMVRRLRHSPERHSSLRYIGIFSDLATITVGMAGGDEGGLPVIGIYLWVTVGNGFRFGPRYLLAAYWLSLVGFSVLLIFVPFWQTHRSIGVGFLAVLAVIPLYVLVLLSRLTAQKDAAEQLSNAKSRFVANVSHELRTPLTGVFAVYDLLRLRKMVPDDRELVGMLGNAITTLKGSVDAVLQMSKLEAGAERAEQRPFNLWFFLQQLAALVRPQAAAKNLAWHLNLEPDVPSTVLGDQNHLSHVLGNLVNNAIKFTPSGSVTLRVSRIVQGRIRFEVVDTGIGIPLDQQERLFERFVQVDTSGTRRYGGTGLGTSIAHDLVNLMGGKIGVVSSPGQGSTFWVELPLSLGGTLESTVSWGGLSEILLIGPAGPGRDAVENKVKDVGLSPTARDAEIYNPPNFDTSRYLAALLIMSATEAANYADVVLRDRGGKICPWIVVASSYSATQFAALQRGGAVGLLPSTVAVDALRANLAALLNRFDLPANEDFPALSASGLVRPLNILLADDNRSNQLLLSRILKTAGHKTCTAESGDDAFDLMAAGELDLAILDLNMPDMSGPDVVKLYRASSVGDAKLPIIILSADATPAAKKESIEAGADDFLTKPVTSASLLAAIARLIAGSAARGIEPPQATGEHQVVSVGPTTSPSQPILVDQERVHALLRISRGERKFLDQYLTAAFEELEKAITDLRIAAMGEDANVSRDALHIIEGTGASIGAVALVANAKTLHKGLSNWHPNDRQSALAEISTTYALTKSTLLANLHQPHADIFPRGVAPS